MILEIQSNLCVTINYSWKEFFYSHKQQNNNNNIHKLLGSFKMSNFKIEAQFVILALLPKQTHNISAQYNLGYLLFNGKMGIEQNKEFRKLYHNFYNINHNKKNYDFV
jgi:TPR repeat protein